MEEFERAEFSCNPEQPKKNSDGEFVMNGDKFTYEKQPIGDEPMVNMKFVRKHGLGLLSCPADWFRTFIPNSGEREHMFCVCVFCFSGVVLFL